MVDEYQLGKELGRGGTSVVREGTKVGADGNEVTHAIKLMKSLMNMPNEDERQRSIQLLMTELEPLRNCPQHPNVVGLYGICMDGKKKK